MARILLGVSGGIAAYKTLELTRLAIKAGHHVRVAQTPESLNFVGKSSFEGITGSPVLIDQFESDPAGGVFADQQRPAHNPIAHLELAANCDLYLVAPATANTIAKIAGGFADNMVTALALTTRKPLLLAPAMNNDMYTSAATAENIQKLRARGVTVLDPGVGELASKGEYGVGRLPEPAELLAAIEDALAGAPGEAYLPRSLDGLKLLVSAGGTREPIDEVRFVGNRSSGKMGFAIADCAAARGAEVTVVAANVALPRNPAINYLDVSTAAELERAVRAEFPQTDALVMAAAVADFTPADPQAGKIKKAGQQNLQIDLVATNDVLKGLKELRGEQLVVGFAAEAGDALLAEANRKLEQKGLDMIVANDISDAAIGFESDENAVTIITSGEPPEHLAAASKAAVAGEILDRIELLLRPIGAESTGDSARPV